MFGTEGSRRQVENIVRFEVQVKMLSVIVISIVGTTVSLLRLLARPIVPEKLMT